ncbi:hypothetical protein ACFQZQ_10220 [Lysobacter koreensis]|uniref:Uncharacterized protein n=1 Tax=Lysobacter koreensis TaxID=266122 RepID=A0ABW2YMQ8_9GAMM
MDAQQTIRSFIAITDQVIREDGLDCYLPTLLVPARDHVMVLEGVPAGIDQEGFAQEWAAEHVAPGESFLLAFRVDEEHYKVVSSMDGLLQHQTLPADAPNNSFKLNPLRGSD